MASQGENAKGYANRTHEFILVIEYSYNNDQELFIRSHHHHVSCVHQELNVTSSIAHSNDIQNRTRTQSSLPVPSSILMNLRGRTAGPGLVRVLSRVT